MKKSILYILLCSLLCSSTAQQSNANISPKVQTIGSGVVAIAASIGTIYCYSKKKTYEKMLIELRPNSPFSKKDSTLTYNELKSYLQEKLELYKKLTFIAGGITLGTLVLTAWGEYRWHKGNTYNDKNEPDNIDPKPRRKHRRDGSDDSNTTVFFVPGSTTCVPRPLLYDPFFPSYSTVDHYHHYLEQPLYTGPPTPPISSQTNVYFPPSYSSSYPKPSGNFGGSSLFNPSSGGGSALQPRLGGFSFSGGVARNYGGGSSSPSGGNLGSF